MASDQRIFQAKKKRRKKKKPQKRQKEAGSAWQVAASPPAGALQLPTHSCDELGAGVGLSRAGTARFGADPAASPPSCFRRAPAAALSPNPTAALMTGRNGVFTGAEPSTRWPPKPRAAAFALLSLSFLPFPGRRYPRKKKKKERGGGRGERIKKKKSPPVDVLQEML